MKVRDLIAIAAALMVGGCRQTPPPPMQVGMWYWHTPFSVSREDLSELKKIGVDTLYVRAATFTTDGVRAKTEFPQHWENNAGGMAVVLTYNFDGGLRSHFGQLTNDEIGKDVVAGIVASRADAAKRNIEISGIQMDVDCPTRLLPKYADLLCRIRGGLEKAGALSKTESFSATALQTWLSSRAYDKLADACDFVAPQFYEGKIGNTLEDIQPIADTQFLAGGMRRADATGKPFFAGLATYGHALLFDAGGRLVGMYHGMGPEDALRHPSLSYERGYPVGKDGKRADAEQAVGENLLVLKATRPDLNGHGLGFHIAYVLPSAGMLARELQAVRQSRPENCRGVILYRYPEPEDELALPLATVAQVFAGKPARLTIVPSLQRRSVPWSLIGSGRTAKSPPYDYTVTVSSDGNVPTLAAPDALSLLVTFDRRGVSTVAPGDFDEAKTGVLTEDGRFELCSPAHANAVLLRRYQVLPGERLRSGPLEVDSDGPIPTRILWKARSDGGFSSVQGDLASRFAGTNPEAVRP